MILSGKLELSLPTITRTISILRRETIKTAGLPPLNLMSMKLSDW